MTELQLYKWIKDESVETHYNHDYTELWACVNPLQLDEFFNMTTASFFEDGGVDCKMAYKYIAIDLIPIAEYYGIEIENVMAKSEENK